VAPSNLPRGGFILVGSALLFAIMATAAKAASDSVSGIEISFVRAVFGVLACVGYHFFVRRLVARNLLGLFLRGATGGIAVYAYFQAIEHLPLGIATLLNYTSPVFTAIWAALLYRQRLTWRAAFALTLTTCGLAAVIHGRAPTGSLGFGVWELTGLFGAVISGLSMVFIAELRKTDGSWEILAAFSLACLLVAAPQTLAHWSWPTAHAWSALLVVGVTSVGAQILMTFAMRDVSATISGIINQITPAASLLLGWALFHDHFSRTTSVGIALTLSGGAMGAALAGRPSALTGPHARSETPSRR
jgi:drug/metabolite transporter (DMT)-like permease